MSNIYEVSRMTADGRCGRDVYVSILRARDGNRKTTGKNKNRRGGRYAERFITGESRDKIDQDGNLEDELFWYHSWLDRHNSLFPMIQSMRTVKAKHHPSSHHPQVPLPVPDAAVFVEHHNSCRCREDM